MTIRWPVSVLPPRRVRFDIAPRSLATPANIYGVGQVVSQDAGIWRATLGDIYVRGRAAVVTFRGIAAMLDGRVGTILVPLCRSYQPLPAGVALSPSDVPHSDGAYFSDGVGYASSAMAVVTSGSASLRATSLSVTISYAGTIEPGQHFSIGERFYRVKGVQYTSGTTAVLSIRPPLREAVASGAILEFDDPVCRMRLASDTEMDLDLVMRREGNPSVNFIEDV